MTPIIKYIENETMTAIKNELENPNANAGSNTTNHIGKSKYPLLNHRRPINNKPSSPLLG